MPLKVVYVDDSSKERNAVASYSYGSGTLQGHLLVQFRSSGLFSSFDNINECLYGGLYWLRAGRRRMLLDYNG